MAMSFEELLKIGQMGQSGPELPPVPFAPSTQAAAPKPIDPVVKEYLMKKRAPAVEHAAAPVAPKEASAFDKYKSDFGDEAYALAQAEADDRKSGLGWAQFAAGLGDAIAGQSPANSAANFERIRKGIDEDTVGAFEKRKASAMSDMQSKKTLDQMDPNSDSSKSFRKMIEAQYPEIARTYGADWANVTAGDQDLLFKPLQLKEQQKARIAAAEAMAGSRADAREAKKEERDFQLKTPYGLANSPEDAKKLKDAHEAKSNFDNKLQQMIDLRTKHGGGAILNREDVARGKQLSKDLLLEYKNMAKLGVLSKSDEDIINAIIPDDPLQYNSPMAAMQGQDPILGQLKSFKSDSDKDFATRVSTRTRSGTSEQIGASGYPKTVRKGTATATVSNADEEAEARAEGFN